MTKRGCPKRIGIPSFVAIYTRAARYVVLILKADNLLGQQPSFHRRLKGEMERMKKSFVCFLFVIFSFLCNGCELRAYHADENEHHDNNPLTVMKWNVSAPNWTHASLVGNELFIAVNADQTNRASVNELLAVNVKTKKQRMLFQSAHEEAMVQWVQANNRWVVWEDSTSFGAESTI